jgi:hypothetical protein
MPTFEQISINFANGEQKGSSQASGTVTYVTANPVEYATIHMDGEELTN